MPRTYVVVTGLPASGKSTIGRALAHSLGIQCIDKDTYLEKLFGEVGVGDSKRRKELSRQSDTAFIDAASNVNRAVLVSHWKGKTSGEMSGTTVDWLAESDISVVELFCSCPVHIAASRFKTRKRHPGHLDGSRSEEEIVDWMSQYQKGLPLGLGELITVCSTQAPDLDNLQHQISAILNINN